MTSFQQPFKPLAQMTLQDWQALGYKSGLEIHQQLLTRRKLFCRCPAGHYRNKTDAQILRHMRPTLSEMGEYDPTALMEFKTKKEIVYLLDGDSVCTYEMDDAPPFEMDDQALDIALEVAMLLKLNLVGELHIARKQYLDGSIPTGFQRTTILGVDGSIPVGERQVGVVQLGLEEDSCRIVSDIGHTVTFRTDRLGMPLIETVTYPELRTPYELKEAGEVIRRLVRSTGKVRTGHGAARQDVNVSIEGGTRVEIKGVPSLKAIPVLAYNEAMRQWNLLRIRDLLLSRGITRNQVKSATIDATQIVAKTRYVPLRHALDRGFRVGAVKLQGFDGILSQQIMPGINFAYEFSERVRVIACLMEQPNILHSDSLERELTYAMWQRIRRSLKADKDDAVVLVWGGEADLACAMKEVVLRANEATMGVPSETRQAHKDGTTGFERLLPGAGRMYPDTDLPPKAITDDRLERIRAGIEPPAYEQARDLKELCVPADCVDTLLRQPALLHLFRQTLDLVDREMAPLLSTIIAQRIKGARRRRNTRDLAPESLAAVLAAVAAGKVNRESLFYLLRELLSPEAPEAARVVERFHAVDADDASVEGWVREMASLVPPWYSGDAGVRQAFLAGSLLKQSQGRLNHEQAQALAKNRLYNEVCHD